MTLERHRRKKRDMISFGKSWDWRPSKEGYLAALVLSAKATDPNVEPQSFACELALTCLQAFATL